MKKIIGMAFAMLMSVAVFGGNCAPEEIIQPDVTLVYKVRCHLTTTKGDAKTTTYTEGGSICSPGDTVTNQIVYREPEKTTIEGWIYDCVSTCNTIELGNIVLWDVKRKVQIVDPEVTSAFLSVIGKKKNRAEWRWSLTGMRGSDSVAQEIALEFAGLGDYSTKKGYFTHVSGSVVGTMSAPYDISKKHPTCEPSQVWKCDNLAEMVDENTVAFGTWSVRIDKGASKKFAKNGHLSVPSYVSLTNE